MKMQFKYFFYPWVLSVVSARDSRTFKEEATAMLQPEQEDNLRFDMRNDRVDIKLEGISYSFESSFDVGLAMKSDSPMDDSPNSYFHARDSNGVTINSVERKGFTAASIADPVTGMVHKITKDPSGKMRVVSNKGEIIQTGIDEPELDISQVSAKNERENERNMQEDGSVLDIMVPWTKKAECVQSGLPKGCNVDSNTWDTMMALVTLCVLETNVAYTQSGIGTQLRLVHAYRDSVIDEDQFSSSETLLHSLWNSTDEVMDDVHTKRAANGADLVALLAVLDDYAGIGYPGPRIDLMFSISDIKHATGYYTFGHEVGHNLGCAHDRGGGDSCGEPGYNYGWRDPQARFRTIMAYPCKSDQCDDNPGQYCQRIQYFSSSTVQYEGLPTGNSMNDNARQINDVIVEVANYFHPPTDCSCASGQFKYDMELLLDNSPNETSWTLEDSNGTTISSGSNYDEKGDLITDSQCLPLGCYTYTLNDSIGDGICCEYGQGGYTGLLYGRHLEFNGFDFGSQAVHTFCGEDVCSTPAPTPAPTIPSLACFFDFLMRRFTRFFQ